MIKAPQRLPDPSMAWMRPDGRPTDAYYQYLREIDQTVRRLVEFANTAETTLTDFEQRLTDLETP